MPVAVAAGFFYSTQENSSHSAGVIPEFAKQMSGISQKNVCGATLLLDSESSSE